MGKSARRPVDLNRWKPRQGRLSFAAQGPLTRRRAEAAEGRRSHDASIHVPPVIRVKRAPGEVSPRGSKRGGPTRRRARR